MSIPVFKMRDGVSLSARPMGQMLKGWLPGTIVNFVQLEDQDGKYLGVDWASKQPNAVGAGGFTINGSYEFKNNFDFRFANDNEPSGFWTPDQMIKYTKSEQNYTLQFDVENHQLSKMGKDITTINFDGGVFRIYTFEKYDNEYIESNGKRGKEIDWKSKVGTLLGCSSRSLFTTEENNVLSEIYEYRIGGIYKDENGKQYIYAVRR